MDTFVRQPSMPSRFATDPNEPVGVNVSATAGGRQGLFSALAPAGTPVDRTPSFLPCRI
jgi:hypothetical protein